MCGRFTLTLNEKLLRELLNISLDGLDFKPNYNIHPGANVPVVVAYDKPAVSFANPSEVTEEPAGADNLSDPTAVWTSARLMRWGLIPPWAKTPSTGYKMINARGETVHEKPAFRRPFQKQRCLVPADGFYEWQKHPNGKIPYRIMLPDNRPFTFPGLWEKWNSPNGEEVYSFTIITVDASPSIRDIHNRMPVIFDNHPIRTAWLDLNTPLDELKGFLTPYDGELISYQVSTLVNSPKNNFPELIDRVS